MRRRGQGTARQLGEVDSDVYRTSVEESPLSPRRSLVAGYRLVRRMLSRETSRLYLPDVNEQSPLGEDRTHETSSSVRLFAYVVFGPLWPSAGGVRPAGRPTSRRPSASAQSSPSRPTSCSCSVEKVDKEKNLIIYRKVQDLKGKHPTGRHQAQHRPRRASRPTSGRPMEWAEVGKTAVFFHNGGASETCIGN